jgi:hypothetical protein
VFEELLTVFNCSVLTVWSAVKFHLNRTLEYITIVCLDSSVYRVCFYCDVLYSLEVCGSCNCVLGIITLFHSFPCSLSLYICRIHNVIDRCVLSVIVVLLLSQLLSLPFHDPLCSRPVVPVHLLVLYVLFLYIHCCRE